MTRYHRQILLPQIGESGQSRLALARVLLVGCGALGTVIADQLCRAGIGFLRIVDRDLVELTNLQRQVLFDEQDVNQSIPKAVAAASRLRAVNSSVRIEPVVADVHSGNIEDIAREIDLILDGTDNVATRYLINDLAMKLGIPWVYGASVGVEGRVMGIRPGETPCLQCVFPEAPDPSELTTCDTAGVLGAACAVTASLQVACAIRILVEPTYLPTQMQAMNVWSGRFRCIDLQTAHDCPCCMLRNFRYLESAQPSAVSLCGRDAVQVRGAAPLKLDEIQSRLARVGTVQRTAYFVRCALHEPAGLELTVFPDARTIVKGTTDLGRARAIVDRFIGG